MLLGEGAEGYVKRLRKPAGYAELIKALVEEDTTVPDYLKNLNIKDAMYLCDVAWRAVGQECVSRCWGKALGTTFVTRPADDPVQRIIGSPPLNPLASGERTNVNFEP